jgi:hypothetical protein
MEAQRPNSDTPSLWLRSHWDKRQLNRIVVLLLSGIRVTVGAHGLCVRGRCGTRCVIPC